jgi:hypothetical protein
MLVKLPLYVKDETVTETCRSIVRKVCKPLAEAKPSDIVAICCKYDTNAQHQFIQEPISHVIRRESVFLLDLQGRTKDCVVMACKEIEMTHSVMVSSLAQHTKQMIDAMHGNAYEIIVTPNSSVLYHIRYEDEVEGLRETNTLTSDAVDTFCRALFPSGETSHEVIETHGEGQHLCRLIRDVAPVFDGAGRPLDLTPAITPAH